MIGSVAPWGGATGGASLGMDLSASLDLPAGDSHPPAATRTEASQPACYAVDGFEGPDQASRCDARPGDGVEPVDRPPEADGFDPEGLLTAQLLFMLGTCGSCGQPKLRCLCVSAAGP